MSNIYSHRWGAPCDASSLFVLLFLEKVALNKLSHISVCARTLSIVLELSAQPYSLSSEIPG